MNAFFESAYRTRGNSVRDLAEGKEVSMEKMFLKLHVAQSDIRQRRTCRS